MLLFTDICDSTALKAHHGALAYRAAAELHNRLFEQLAAEEKLMLIKNTGDGYFARTTSVAAAVRFALRLQHGLRTMAWPQFPLVTRVAIHAGEVADITTLGQADVLAPAADLVARIMGLAGGGQILLSRWPFDEARHFIREHPPVADEAALELRWLAHGPYLFKGCEEAVEVFEVGAEGLAPLVAPPDGEKAKRAIRPGDEETLGWRPAEGLEIPGRPGWRLVQKLGAGGFGEVWAGEHAKTRERRAYKFCFDAERLRALKREVTLTRLLRETLGEREDIVRIYDLRLDEPPYFLESELATDGSLLQWAERQGGLAAITLEQRIELVAATATALAAAHSVGVLHKDIKPTNVLIFTGKDGVAQPRLVDFGIGTLADPGVLAQHGITGAGFTQASLAHSSGTPTYSPPEFLAGKPFTVQGDIYSLGVMLYQLITGDGARPLAEGWQRDVSDTLLREDIALCVDGDPARRFAGANELAERLRALPARRAEAQRQLDAMAAERSRRRRIRTLFATSLVALLLLAAAVPLILWALREKERAQQQSHVADAERDKARAQVREASRSDFATAQARLADGKWQEAIAYFGRAIRYDPENRNAQDAFWLALRHGKRDAGLLPRHALRHKGEVTSATFSPDGTRILTTSEDRTARLWDARTGQPLGAPMVHEHSVVSGAFSPDGARVITGAYNGSARIWDATTGTPAGEPLVHFNVVKFVTFSPDGARVVTCTFQEARLWDAKTGKPIGEALPHGRDVNWAAFSPDGTRVATASGDGRARLWDATTGTPLGAEMKHDRKVTRAVLTVDFSPDGKHLVTASEDGTVRTWDGATGEPAGEPLVASDYFQRGAVFSPDGQYVLSASDGDTAQLWDAKTGAQIAQPLTHGASVHTARFSADGARILTASRDCTARIWDAKTGLPIGLPLVHEGDVTSAVFDAAGGRVLTRESNTAYVWDDPAERIFGHMRAPEMMVEKAEFTTDSQRLLITGAREVSLRDVRTGKGLIKNLRHEGTITAVGLSPDGRQIATASRDKTARLWDAATGEAIGAPLVHDEEVKLVAFSRDGATLATATDKSARFWDARTGRALGETPPQGRGIEHLAFSPDGTRLFVASREEAARIWEVPSGKLLVAIKGKQIAQGEFHPSGTRLVVADEFAHAAQIYDATTGQALSAPMRHAEFVENACFSPDGRRVLTLSLDKTARLWSAETGEPIGVSMSLRDKPRVARFNREGTRIATLAARTVQLWDGTTGQPLGPPLPHISRPEDVRFSPDGSQFVVAADMSSAQVWDLPSGPSLSASEAQAVADFAGGARFDAATGVLTPIPFAERWAIWAKLERELATRPEYLFAARATLDLAPDDSLSPRMNGNVRERATCELGRFTADAVQSAYAIDPAHPALPFALGVLELQNSNGAVPNPARAVWLLSHGIKRLPPDADAELLYFAARYGTAVVKAAPEQKAAVLSLIERGLADSAWKAEFESLRQRLSK